MGYIILHYKAVFYVGINRFWLVGLVGIFRVLFRKNRLFQPAQTRLKRLKKHLRDYVT